MKKTYLAPIAEALHLFAAEILLTSTEGFALQGDKSAGSGEWKKEWILPS